MAYQLARFEHAPDMFSQIDAARIQLKNRLDVAKGYDVNLARENNLLSDYVAEVDRRKQLMLNPTDVGIIPSTLSNVGFIWYLTAPASATVIDATGKFVMPGIIDAHSHAALENGINEGSESVTPEVQVQLKNDDAVIYRALAGGVTAALLLHGSANTIGGQAMSGGDFTVDAQGRLTAASSGSAVNLTSEVTGVLPVADMAGRLGMTSLPREGADAVGSRDAALTLGAFETSPIDMANVYATLAARGYACPAVVIERVVPWMNTLA